MARIVRRHLLGERVVRLKLFQDHGTGHARGRVFSGPFDELALGQLAVDIAVEDFEDPLVEVPGRLAAGGGLSCHGGIHRRFSLLMMPTR